ncbi:hypothetical protein [Cupriavidus metallidurans]|uniref:hypothetical protein n=1 Tax=Cupriavidus metallidurans TaxID=119219 RepID=UPI001CCA1EA0|nr:hypothetical protein [Cupriavidus metallidurans]UBM12819.1 hypothetical protein LAI70_28100 [Cupriavidus metallidurans]
MAFEAWARGEIRRDKLPLERHAGNDAYKDSRTYTAWYGWQARAAQQMQADAGAVLESLAASFEKFFASTDTLDVAYIVGAIRAHKIAGAVDYRKRFETMVYMLGEITQALGISDDDAACAGGNDLILAAIAELRQPAQAWQEGYKAGIEKGRKDPAMHEAKYLEGYRAAQQVQADAGGGGLHGMPRMQQLHPRRHQ